MALLIAFVSVAGAVVAWRASLASGSSSDADLAGLRASINLTETRAIGAVNAYSSYGTYVRYYQNRQLVSAIQSNFNEGEDDARLIAESQDALVLAQSAFPNQYLNRDGTYNIQRQLGEALADAARKKDINPDPHYVEADVFRSQADKLLIALTALVISLVFYTLIEVVSDRLRYVLVTAGSVLAIASLVGAFLIETGRL